MRKPPVGFKNHPPFHFAFSLTLKFHNTSFWNQETTQVTKEIDTFSISTGFITDFSTQFLRILKRSLSKFLWVWFLSLILTCTLMYEISLINMPIYKFHFSPYTHLMYMIPNPIFYSNTIYSWHWFERSFPLWCHRSILWSIHTISQSQFNIKHTNSYNQQSCNPISSANYINSVMKYKLIKLSCL